MALRLAEHSKDNVQGLPFFHPSAFLRGVRRIMSKSWLDRKRSFDYRIAHPFVRRWRMTVQQFSDT
jgi:hypothetical protein